MKIGLIWFLIATPWLHGALTFILILFNIEFSEFIRFIILYSFIPLAAFLWMDVFTNFLYQDKKKILLTIFGLLGLICECLFFAFLFIDQKILIGDFAYEQGIYFSAKYSNFIRITMPIFLAASFVTFMIFATNTLKATDLKVRLKSKFLIIAFITFTICSVLDMLAIFSSNPISVVIIRILLMLSSILFYFGWFLPDFIVKMIKDEK
ncbi:MAG: hypothetical protein EU541_03535 [Promethearchaeota archaeon]|nr:MAG: hypothetical protein EU541_03535 [Candidatus Lokiarchaeota archaeon]